MKACNLTQGLTVMLLLSSTLGYAQKKNDSSDENSEPLRKVYQHLDSTDSRSLRSDYFLNKGFLLEDRINQQRQIQPDNQENNVVFSSPEHFQSYSMGLKNAALGRTDLPSEEEVTKIIASYNTQGNIVPVGILQAQGTWLKDYEVEESIEAKKKGRRMNKAYEQVDIYSASVLKEKVYSGEVTFVTPATLYHVGDQPVRQMYIDVADGKGFREVKPDSRFTAQHDSDGEKGIALKFSTDQGEVISYSVLNVVTLEVE